MPTRTLTERFPLILHETASIWRNLLDKRLKPLGLSQAKWRTLLHLSLAEKPLTQTELAARLGIEGATLVPHLDGLARDGWIIRKDVVLDRRSKTVELTEKSQDTLTQIHGTANQLRRELLSFIPESELQQCLHTLEKIKSKAETLS